MTRAELEFEQEYVTGLYARLDAARAEAASRLAGASGDRDAAAVWRAEAARLAAVEDGLCFGRLDTDRGDTVHIGRFSFFDDDTDDVVLLDWRAPAARPFYTATAADPQGLRGRRRIETRARVVTGVDDELFAAADDGGGLVGEAALMAALTAERTGRMRDIVTTLRAEQDRIIRDDFGGVLVVQGGPGTGKTAVALHRLAYLLYTREHLRSRGVLVVGPSRVFLDYIGHVLPGLGENSVVTATTADLYPGVEVTREDTPDTAAGKGRAEMAARVAAEIRSRVRIPGATVEVEFEQRVLALSPSDCRAAAAKARARGLPHNVARSVFQHEVVEILAGRLAEQLESLVLDEAGNALDGGSADGSLGAADLRALAAAGVVVGPEEIGVPRGVLDEADRHGLRDALFADPGVADVLDEVWPSLLPADVVADVLSDYGLVEGPGWSAADVPLLDEAAVLLDGGGGEAYGHVVVDEAQELSEMAWRMLMRRCPSRSMTVVGDLAQTGTAAGTSSWARVLAPHVDDRWRLAELTVNYRTPAEIMAVAAEVLAARHPDLSPPRSVRAAGERPWRVRADDLAGALAEEVAAHTDGTLAIITPEAHLAPLSTALSLRTPPDLTEAVVLITPGQAKGLEFDAALLVDPARVLDTPLGHNDLYVALTRATRRLGVVHPGEPPAELVGIPQRGNRTTSG
ncbi:HelD family protein [Actinokineospora auranticolor]|uniref:HelD family protein n=1 Tax=Actinokineospora auranticolor TaxID=155976 RepID=UPI003CCB9CD9